MAGAMVGVMSKYYAYVLEDADRVPRYFGKGRGRRMYTHRSVIQAVAAGILMPKASKMHRRFADELRIGRDFQEIMVQDGLSQADAYALETDLIAVHRRETEGGTLWNVLAGGEGFQGVTYDDWVLVARQAAETKKLSGSGLRAGAKAAETKRRQRAERRGSSLRLC